MIEYLKSKLKWFGMSRHMSEQRRAKRDKYLSDVGNAYAEVGEIFKEEDQNDYTKIVKAEKQ